MDATASPEGGSEPSPTAISPPKLFDKFPATMGTLASPTATDEANVAGTMPQAGTWAHILAAPAPIHRLPAWHRVPVQAHPANRFRGIIMKRIGMPNSATGAFRKAQPDPATAAANLDLSAEDGMPLRRVRRRLEIASPADEEPEFKQIPETPAGAINAVMVAKVDVSNACLAVGFINPPLERHMRHDDRFRAVPTKRSLGVAFGFGRERPNCGNYFLRTYPNHLVPVMVQALRGGQVQVDMKAAAIAETSALLQALRPDPRQRLAAVGVPELSDIKDKTEPPESPGLSFQRLAVQQSPSPTAQAASSTTGMSKAVSPAKSDMGYLTDGMLNLMPRSAPGPAASPKISSAADLLAQIALERAATPSNKSGTSSPSLHTAPEYPSPEISNNPPRVFRVPSSSLGSTTPSASPGSEQRSPEQPHPAEYPRPVAPTPSRWNREDPATQYGDLTPKPASIGQKRDSLGLIDAIPALTPCLPRLPLKIETPNDFDFGETSTVFMSSPALNTPDRENGRRQTMINKSRRRRSEPLARSVLRAQERRATASPQKLHSLFEASRDSLPAASSLSPLSYERTIGKKPAAPSADTPLSRSMLSEAAPPSPRAYFDDANDTTTSEPTLAMARKCFPGTYSDLERQNTPSAPGVYNIDMRQNPDIFGKQRAPSPAPSEGRAAVDQLALMAEARCDGLAKVVVSQENGRLVVRFKLPTKYASMFPESQGRDESHFESSPLSFSRSPRITFNGQHMPGSDTDHLEDVTGEADYTLPSFPSAEAPEHTPTYLAQPSPSRNLASTMASLEAASALSDQAGPSSAARCDATLLVPDLGRRLSAQNTPSQRRSLLYASAEKLTPSQNADLSHLFASSLTPCNRRASMSGIAAPHSSPEHLQAPSAEPTPTLNKPAEGQKELVYNYIFNGHRLMLPVPEPPKPQSPPSHDAPATTSSAPATSNDSVAQDHIHSTEERDEALRSASAEHTPVAHAPEQGAVAKTAEPTPANTAGLIAVANTVESTVETAEPNPNLLSGDEESCITAIELTPIAKATASPMPTATSPNSTGPATLVTSFTPVNQAAAGPAIVAAVSPKGNNQHETVDVSAVPQNGIHATSPAAASSAADPATQGAVTQEAATKHDDDSPGRDYMRDFIKRSRPKKTSTTETGSPIAPPAKRLPLGAKSPNTTSPQKSTGKRKLGEDEQDGQSPAKNAAEHAPKKARRMTKATKRRAAAKPETEEEAVVTVAPEAANQAADTAEDDAEMDHAPTARRSSRIRGQHQPEAAPRSSIPTPIKLGPAGAGRGSASGLKSANRSEQHDLTVQTRSNTRKNRGHAEYPAQVLQKITGEASGQTLTATVMQEEEPSDQDSGSSSDKARKRVGWKNPLESHHEEKLKKGKGAAKGKATKGSGIAKPVKSMPPKQRGAKLAESLGMAGNGTPAKPQRMTRSRTRTTEN